MKKKRRRNVQTYEWEGKERTVRELAEMVGVSTQAIYARLSVRKSMEDCLKPKAQGRHPMLYKVKGHEYTLPEIARIANIDAQTLRSRLAKGMELMDALTTPVRPIGMGKRRIEKEMRRLEEERGVAKPLILTNKEGKTLRVSTRAMMAILIGKVYYIAKEEIDRAISEGSEVTLADGSRWFVDEEIKEEKL